MKVLTDEDKAKRKKTLVYICVYAAITLFAFIVYYFALPPINPASIDFWVFLTFLAVIYLLPVGITYKKGAGGKQIKGKTISGLRMFGYDIRLKKIMLFALIPVAVIVLGVIIGSTVFQAKNYAGVITVSERVFQDDMEETVNVENVALMDSKSAAIFGQRTLGELAGVVSQYTLSDSFTQINYENKPRKIANLEYDGFFKWIGNRGNGIPGYVLIDPVGSKSEFVPLGAPIKYAKSAYFGEDLYRKLRFLYPTKIFGEARFEIDDDGNPFFIVPCLTPKVFPFGAYDVTEAIIFNPCVGTGRLYAVEDTPSWVDIVFDGDLACQKYNWYGELSGGFINSIIGNKGCKRTTDDYGYVIADDDVWYYTGVTSVTGDSSNIGFILTNARTGEYKSYAVHGAEEHSSMGAAEGEVQEKGYKASFPALINVRGQATYIMVLKDDNGIVKMFALVNAEQYNVVATGNTQADAMKKYISLLEEKGIIEKNPLAYAFVVAEIKTAQLNGNTIFYFREANGPIYYKVSYADCETAVMVKVGDGIYITYEPTDELIIKKILSLKIEDPLLK